MVKRIQNLSKWNVLASGEALQLEGDHRRKIRVELNAPMRTRVDVIAEGLTVFLGVIEGLDVVEFTADGVVQLVFSPLNEAELSEVWYFTSDGDQYARSTVNPVTFLELPLGGVVRNPQVEMMIFKQQQNNLRLQAQVAKDRVALEARFAELSARLEGDKPKPATVDPATPASVEPAKPEPATSAPAKPA